MLLMHWMQPTANFHFWRVLCLRVLALLLTAAAGFAAAQDTPQYDALIRQAQAGDTAPVLNFLRQADIKGALAERYVSDWIAVASWAGRNQEVAELYAKWFAQLSLPAPAHATAARAMRNLRLWEPSIAAYQRALKIESGSTPYRTGLIYVLADAGRDADALSSARQLLAVAPRDPQRILALAYVHTAAQRHFEALEEVTRARDIAPENAQVETAYIDALQSAGLPGAGAG